jgi:hypothetical protein
MTLGDSESLLSYTRTTTVGSSQRTDAVLMGATTPVGIIVSTNTLVSTSITFEVAQGSTYTFYPLVTSTGGSITVTTSTQAAQQYRLDHTLFMGVNAIKAVMSSTQDNNKVLTWVTRPVW